MYIVGNLNMHTIIYEYTHRHTFMHIFNIKDNEAIHYYEMMMTPTTLSTL